MAGVATYGVFSSTLGIASVINGLVSGSGSSDVQIGIQVGQAGDNVGTPGTLDQIYVYDTQNGFEGSGGSDASFDNGGFGQVGISTATDGVEAGFIDIVGSDDALCMAWVTVENKNTIKSAWTGDWGYQCGIAWHKSSVYAGPVKKAPKGTSKRYVPKCTWVDKDHTGVLNWDSIKIGLAYMNPNVNGKGSHSNFDYYCGSAIAIKDGKPIAQAPHPSKRGLNMQKRSEKFSKYVIHSDIPEHKGGARELCESATSYGADFIDPDGMYCDMDKKQLYPLCSASDVPGCMTLHKGAGSATFFQKGTNSTRQHFRFFERGVDYWPDFDETKLNGTARI